MDRKDVAATVIASAAVIALSAVFVWTVLSRMSGEIEAGPFVNMCVSLTMILSFVVLIYGAYMMRDSGSSGKRYEEYALRRNPRLKIFPLSAKTGEGVDAWTDWLRREVRAWQQG